ncbi:unnamed protein product [Toxocara canis]|uniref:NRF domain-containing protein n=1 Tax=Toxocara canis TaxID=6265 RepID=A0A183V734_TOXCA|nr:unnamed protein product [Toxocara canis]
MAAMRYLRLVFLVLLSALPNRCCLLCQLRLPPRPRPIDHFQLPSAERIASPESIAELCHQARRLHVSDKCRQGVAKILCSLADLIAAKSSECIASDGEERCAECSRRNAQIANENFWALICKSTSVVTGLDSLGKMPSAISEGNHHWLGEYEQCVQLKKSGSFDGRYCLLKLEVPDSDFDAGCPQTDPLEIDLGICAPEHCSEEELNAILTCECK